MHGLHAREQMQRRDEPRRDLRWPPERGRHDGGRISESEILTPFTPCQPIAPAAAHGSRGAEARSGQRSTRLRRVTLGFAQEKIGQDDHEFAHIAYGIGA